MYELSEEPTPLNLYEKHTSFELFEESTSFELSEELISSLNCETSDNISISSSSNFFYKKRKFNQPKPKQLNRQNSKQQYIKSSWVWGYFELSEDRKFDICKVKTMNLNNQEVKCGHKFLYDGSMGNMSSHLQDKHDLHENRNKI
ncbi:15594_t:CDS:1, partial [Dentiscutata erythropus]